MEARGIRNNNPLNIRKGSKWRGEDLNGSDPYFCVFKSRQWGIRAALKLMVNHIMGLSSIGFKANTLKKLIAVWAPSIENATDKYLRFVCDRTGVGENATLDPTDKVKMCRIAQAMAEVECGVQIDIEDFFSAWDLLWF